MKDETHDGVEILYQRHAIIILLAVHQEQDDDYQRHIQLNPFQEETLTMERFLLGR
jgi:hypothetical protein